MELSEQMKNVQTGHICLVVCCMIYLAWWSITFNPMKKFPALPKYILFLGIAIFGIAGVVILIGAMGKLPSVNGSISNTVIMLTGIVTYGILLYVTGHFLHRQVTTELFLIIGWTVLELCVISSTYRASAVSMQTAIIFAMIVIVAAVVGMICYLMYYNLTPVVGFYDGMVPLILFGGVMAIEVIL